VSSSSFEEQKHNPPPEKESSLTPAAEISVGDPPQPRSANSSPPPVARWRGLMTSAADKTPAAGWGVLHEKRVLGEKTSSAV
ncbi:hypothetical protein E2320_022340, partial [Naja naja]